MTLRCVVAVLLISVASHAAACECGPLPPPLKELAQVDAVFTGEIIDINPKTQDPNSDELANGYTATVKVTKSWKGNVTGTVKVHTGDGYGDCGIGFTGEPWLFYASRRPDGEWYTSVCYRSAPLKYTGEETAELDGHLPDLPTPPLEPTLQCKGKINDAGYKGYVFTLRNRLHKRFFYCDYQFTNQMIQVQRDGRWVDYAPNRFDPPKNRADAAKILADWKPYYTKLDAKRALVFLDRSRTTTVFVGGPLDEPVWRVGFQYIDEQELDAGQKIQRSKHYVWSEPIRAGAPMKTLGFREAFDDVPGIIPDPLGRESSPADH